MVQDISQGLLRQGSFLFSQHLGEGQTQHDWDQQTKPWGGQEEDHCNPPGGSYDTDTHLAPLHLLTYFRREIFTYLTAQRLPLPSLEGEGLDYSKGGSGRFIDLPDILFQGQRSSRAFALHVAIPDSIPGILLASYIDQYRPCKE